MSDERLPDEVLNAESGDESLTIVRIFDAPREEVFKAWTDPGVSHGGSASTARRYRSTPPRWTCGRTVPGAR